MFRGEVSVSLRAADLRLTGVDQNAVCYQQRIYENARRGEHSRQRISSSVPPGKMRRLCTVS